jgi:hypothetical protein
MYIVVNKRVLNALNLNIGDIQKFDKEALLEIYKWIATSYGGHDYHHYNLIYDFANTQKWFEKNISHSNYNEDSGISERIYDFEGVREGYYFIVDDGRYIICSKLYETEKLAERARDVLLTKANKIIAKLYKVEI